MSDLDVSQKETSLSVVKKPRQENKCPFDNKRCYIHYDSDGYEDHCRHGNGLAEREPPCFENELKEKKVH